MAHHRLGRYTSRPEDGPLKCWDMQRLWELAKDLPVKRVPVSSIADLDRVCWFGHPVNKGWLTCRDVVEHAKLIVEADFDYPIMLSAAGQVMDGMHRVVKAYLLGLEEVPAVQFATDPEPDSIEPVPKWLSNIL